jgi:DNA-binding NtrC family response regulator
MTQPPPITTIVTLPGQPIRVERRRFRLQVVSGPDAGASKTFSEDVVGIGSAAGNALVLTDPMVSRHHVRIEVREDGLRLRDLRSTNGVHLQGLRITGAYLRDGARFRVGESEIEFALTAEVDALPVSQQSAFHQLLGTSVAMRRVFATLERVAPTDATVLVEGQSGTGKELVAEALHATGPRATGPFVIVDCGALPAGVIESELFGHEKGAFTGAVASRAGAFEQAHGGTLFLDEIGELDITLQSRLLRALDRRKVKRVGGADYKEVDVRVIAATNRDLEELVNEGDFRDDLFYRLAVVRVAMPPLRERAGDIELLSRHFIQQFRVQHSAAPPFEITPEVLRGLNARNWPGNVRELRNFIERAVVLASPELLINPEVGKTPTGGPGVGIAFEKSYAEARDEWVGHFEREYVKAALARSGGNVAQAARDCKVDRAYLFRLIKKHDMDRK